MASITDFDFSKCRYDPRSKDFITTISNDIPEFKSAPSDNRQKIFAYIVAIYDKNSPLHRKFPDYYQRKIQAADMVGLPRNRKGAFTQASRDLLEGVDESVNRLIVSYLANTGDVEYMMLVNEWAMFQDYTATTLSGSYPDGTHKILQSISNSLKERMRSLFGSGESDELTRVRTMLYEIAEKDRYKLNVENVVKLVSNDGDVPPDWGPYGVGYEVEKLKFVGDK
jgi:hypothetical protein